MSAVEMGATESKNSREHHAWKWFVDLVPYLISRREQH